MEIDRIDWHWDAINDNVSEEEHWERAGAHIGYYIEWAYKKGFAPNNSEFNDVAEYQKVINSEVNGIRFLIENCNTKFWDVDLNEEGQKFTSYAYDTYVNNLETILGHKPYTEKYNEQDLQSVFKYLDKEYKKYLTKLSFEPIMEENETSSKKIKGKEIIMKDKIKIGDMILLIVFFIVLLIISIAGFSAFFDSGEEKNIEVLFVGILFGLLFILLLPSLTFKRPYIRVNSNGVYFNELQGFQLYGKEIFIPWNRIDAIIYPNKVLSIKNKEFQENELNARSLATLDKFKGITSTDLEDEAYWLENGIYIVTKNERNYFPEIHAIAVSLDVENIKKLWIDNVK